MKLIIPVAHDFTCPWCWIMVSQCQKLKLEFPVEFDYRGYELWPEELEWPKPTPPEPKTPNKPDTPSRIDLALLAEGISRPDIKKPHRMRTHNAHEAVEYAKTLGLGEELLFRLYDAYVNRGEAVGEIAVIRQVAEGLIPDVDAMVHAIEARQFKHEIVGFDDPAHANGIFNVPTFIIGGERYAEQPLTVLREAVRNALPHFQFVYPNLSFPAAPHDRPYVAINMVTTLDGKSVIGSRQEPVQGLGSYVDYETMRQIESQVDAVLIGAGTLRATPGLWYPAPVRRYVLSRSGNVDKSSRFFTDAPELAQVVQGDLREVLAGMRKEGVKKLLLEGGSETNAEFLAAGLVDEIFLTLAPKVKLGSDVPTLAGGQALSADALLQFELVSCTPVGDEVFLRYRRRSTLGS